MTSQFSDLADLGWTPFFNTQLDLDELSTTIPVRVMAVHRNSLSVQGLDLQQVVTPFTADPDDPETAATIGDWLLLDPQTLQPLRLLDRKSLFKRRAAGHARKLQLIAANVDTLFIVTSCNQDFNVARLERYLALASEAEVLPIIVITKADLTDTPEDFVRRATKLMPGLLVEVLDARDPDSAAVLAPWCALSHTVALVGSSGVGKSTLVNTLTASDDIATQGPRTDDNKGRHTTTARSLHRLPEGGWLLDTPGMRELQLTDVQAGLAEVFADIVDLTQSCRFADCRHEVEPGCAVLAAVEAGVIDAARLKRWQKLVSEDTHNTETLTDRRARDRAFGKMVKGVTKNKRKR
ncbi:MAG: ribosome biogenesis GTPase [Paracoccaceae bacterium]|jgi:ribosome biogenesis GTPase